MSNDWDSFGLVGSPSWHACKHAHAEIERLRALLQVAHDALDEPIALLRELLDAQAEQGK